MGLSSSDCSPSSSSAHRQHLERPPGKKGVAAAEMEELGAVGSGATVCGWRDGVPWGDHTSSAPDPGTWSLSADSGREGLDPGPTHGPAAATACPGGAWGSRTPVDVAVSFVPGVRESPVEIPALTSSSGFGSGGEGPSIVGSGGEGPSGFGSGGEGPDLAPTHHGEAMSRAGGGRGGGAPVEEAGQLLDAAR